MRKRPLSPGARRTVLMICSLLLTACAGGPPPGESPESSTERYEGTLPCSNCSGIATTLVMERDSQSGEPTTFYLHEMYIDATGGERVNTRWGDWSQQRDIAERTIYRIEPEIGRQRSYLLNESNALQPLNDEGSPVNNSDGEPVTLAPSAPDATSSRSEQGNDEQRNNKQDNE